MKKSEMVQNKGKYKYFQPVITNNTMVVSARVTEEKEETIDRNKVYKFKVNLSEKKGDSIEKITDNKEDEINNKVIENIREQLQKEMAAAKLEEEKIEETISEAPELKTENVEEVKLEETVETEEEKKEEVKAEETVETEEEKKEEVKAEETVETEEEKTEEVKAEEVVETEEENTEEVKAEEVVETEEENTEEVKVDEIAEDNSVEKEAIANDLTTKLDLPLINKTIDNSVPFRREAPDNIKEFKVKLFLLATNAKKPVRILVNRKRFLIGSDFEQMDCVIRNNQYISRCHAKIHYESDCYYLEDAGSMNGTYINGVKLAEGLKYKLLSGDIINLADCRFEVSMK